MNVFGSNTKGNSFDGECFVARRIDDGDLERKREQLEGEVENLRRNATLPVWLLIAMYILLGYGAICVLNFLMAPLGEEVVSYAEAYSNAAWVIWSGVPALLIGVVLWVIKFVRQKRVEGSSAYAYVVERAEKFAAESREALGVPEDAVDLDVFAEPYKLNKNGKRRHGSYIAQYYNSSWWTFREGDAVCFADTTVVYKIPLAEIERIVRIEKRIMFQGWNKSVAYSKGEYKQYKIRANNNGALFVKPYISVRIRGDWELVLPPYELASFEKITGKLAE